MAAALRLAGFHRQMDDLGQQPRTTARSWEALSIKPSASGEVVLHMRYICQDHGRLTYELDPAQAVHSTIDGISGETGRMASGVRMGVFIGESAGSRSEDAP
jgi:hypothetical protein